ncbi:unnamed protein product [Rotaria magnacalcarata]|uniref:SH3 domain-containing protein n=1 Tax=Rotaria magnacalcarata TaxID=392030 RepID=A0A819EQ55_9BILA|nr:unnamed protein product [Rotaria magnacalcarata]
MIFKRFFERARIRCSICTKACLCTTARRDSIYDDPDVSFTRKNERQSSEQYGFARKDKPARLLMRRTSIDEPDKDDTGTSIMDKLRRASAQTPANIPMLVVVSFNPDEKGLQKKQIEIQRGFPVNAQYILSDWLFIKTADNEEGFVPYLCCRPIFRRQSMKSLINTEYSYKLHDFELQKSEPIKSSLTPPRNKKLSVSTNLSSPSCLFKKSSSYKRRQDLASSSCGGDSGVSDCESSTNNHLYLELSTKNILQSSNIQSCSNTVKKTGLIVQDIPCKRPSKINQIKSQLLMSSNSAFTQIIKKNQRQESNRCQPFQEKPGMLLSSSSFRSHSHRLYDSYDETAIASLKYNFNNQDITSSPYIRRTPHTRRSLPYHSQSALKKPLRTKVSFSPDPLKQNKEQCLRSIVLAEPSLPFAIIPKKPTIEKHFSDLSLNQIENDSLSPSTPVLSNRNRPSLSYSSSSSSSSSSSATSSSTDDSAAPFIQIQMNNHRAGGIPVLYTSSNITTANNNNNSDNQTKRSTSFVHNVSITV